MIRIEALPAADGDCLLVQWSHDGSDHRMLIDGGRGRTVERLMASLPVEDRRIDIIVCTHIDADHIEGLLRLFTVPPKGFSVGEVWFNGYRHLRRELVGPRQGDRLERLLDAARVPWNTAFGRSAVVVPDDGPLPVVRLPGLTITLLAPHWNGLARLDAAWTEVLAEARIDPLQGRVAPKPAEPDLGTLLADLPGLSYEPDQSPANGSSICFIAEHDNGGRVLFAADAPAEALLAGMRRLSPDRAVAVDLCKVPHHGSGYNVSSDLIAALDCRHWLFSTSGARHGHPDRRAVARIIGAGREPVLWFNYLTDTTKEYAEAETAVRYGFQAVHPAADQPGISLVVSAGKVEADR